MIRAYYRGAAINSIVTDAPTVRACPDCKTHRFVLGMIAVEDWIARQVVCENGHRNAAGDLMDLRIEDMLEELEPPEPDDDEFENYIKFGPQFSGTSDRHAAIAAAAWFETILAGSIRKFLAIEQMDDELLQGGYALLSTFATRIAFCYAFGLISEQDYRALRCLKSIRNDLAHNLEDLSLEEESLAAQTQNLARHIGLEVEKDAEPRSVFNDAIRALFRSLATKQNLVRRCSRMPFDPTGQSTAH